MKSADRKEQNYQFKTKVDMEHKFSITDKLRHFLYCLLAVVLWLIYKRPEKVSLINDNLCCRYGYCKYPFVKNKGQFPRFIRNGSYGIPAIYDHYDNKRYFLFPLPTWHIKCLKSAKVDGKKILADTFYILEEGKFIKAK